MQPPRPPPPQPAPAKVSVSVDSTPRGAKVQRLDSNEALGTTPLKLDLEPAGLVTLELTLEGRTSVRKEVSLSGNVALSVELPPADAPKKKKKGPVSKDATLDPFKP